MHESRPSATQIVSWLRTEEEATFERGAAALERLYAPSLLKYLMTAGGLEYDDASDVLNQVLYRAIRKIDQLQDPHSLAGWLFRSAYRGAVDWHRRNARRGTVLPIEDTDLFGEPQENDLASSGRPQSVGSSVARMRRAMAVLAERDRNILLAIAHGLTNEEMAEMLGVQVGHARVLRHRAAERLRRAYSRVPEPGDLSESHMEEDHVDGTQ
jgi:RNA polymerase sigma-70 factor (ECF subfamily)